MATLRGHLMHTHVFEPVAFSADGRVLALICCGCTGIVHLDRAGMPIPVTKDWPIRPIKLGV